MNNERLYDLPLQISHNLFNLGKEQESKSKDMPKQIKNDLYRHYPIGKENLQSKYQTKHVKTSYPVDPEILFSQNSSSIKKQNNRSSHLREIIKKKLFSSEKNGLKLQPKYKNIVIQKQQKSVQELCKPNRYQTLLSQIYGTPKNQRQRVKNQSSKTKQNQLQMQRHQSVRNITEILKTQAKQGGMGRYRSQSTFQKVPLCSQCKGRRKNSISKLKTELSKIPTYLDLYNQKKKLVLVQ